MFRQPVQKFFNYLFKRFLAPRISLLIEHDLLHKQRVFNANGNLTIGQSTAVLNALFNLSSGNIIVGNNVSFGHNVSCLTGTHDVNKQNEERQKYPVSGNDIIIEDGVWIGSNVTILGPCVIGKNSAIAAMSLVNKINVPANCLYGGVPAKFIKSIDNKEA